MHRIITGLLAAIIVVFGSMFGAQVVASNAGTTDTTVVTIDPNMPDDFLNLYPELDGDELAELPGTGTASDSYAGLGLLAIGITAVAVAVATARRRPPDSFD